MKKLILFFLLVTSAITNCVLDVDLHLRNLSNTQLKKIQELSELSKQIAEKHALIDSWNQQIASLFYSEEEFSKEISEKELVSFVQKFGKDFCEKKDLSGILTEGFYNHESYKFNFLKVFLVRRYFEQLLVAQLVESYEKCLQEFNEIE